MRKLPYLLYNLLLILLLPLFLLSYVIKLVRRADYRARWSERLGVFPPAKATGGLHVHAVSLGESKVAAKVVDQLLNEQPELPVIFTCSTATASFFIREHYKGRVDHCYLPFDFPWAVAAFLHRYKPRACVIVEVEWWPNLIRQCSNRGVPVSLINGKMTANSAATYQKLAPLFHNMTAQIHQVLAQDPASYERFKTLGVSSDKLFLANNIKFDEQPVSEPSAAISALKSQLSNRSVWIAGSTHTEDEEQVLDAFSQLKAQLPELLLILVPRHPERFERVAEDCLNRGFTLARRSQQDAILADTDILLGDSLGELAQLYGLAQVAFIGGSITARGGHNPLEAAVYGIPMLMGPSRFNCLDIATALEDSGALVMVNTAEDILKQLLVWFQQPQTRLQAGQCSAVVMAENRGALQFTSARLQLSLQKPSASPV